MSDLDYDPDPDYDPDSQNCQTCDGEGVEECQDHDSAEGCWQPDCTGDCHTCPNCKGSGLARDQWYW